MKEKKFDDLLWEFCPFSLTRCTASSTAVIAVDFTASSIGFVDFVTCDLSFVAEITFATEKITAATAIFVV